MINYTIFVGLDVHKDSITVAMARSGKQDVESIGIINNDSASVVKMVKRLEEKGGKLSFCYEAGPCGYGLYRQITSLGHSCMVAASSLVPQRPGDQVKNDRRDARKLARHLRNGDLTPVWVPDEDNETLRDLSRARQSAKEDLHRNRQKLLKYLLRQGIRSPQGMRNWGSKYWQWLKSLKLDNPIQQMILSEHIYAIEECDSRVSRFEKEIDAQSQGGPHQKTMAALQGLKGIALITSTTILSEVGDLTRFKNPRQLMAYAGLVPSESSSGNSIKRGSITKTGNSHLRKVIVEAAWHYRHRPTLSIGLKKRQEELPEEIKQISWKAQHRLNLKFRRMVATGKPSQKAVVGVARELLGFIWAVGQAVGMETELLKAV